MHTQTICSDSLENPDQYSDFSWIPWKYVEAQTHAGSNLCGSEHFIAIVLKTRGAEISSRYTVNWISVTVLVFHDPLCHYKMVTFYLRGEPKMPTWLKIHIIQQQSWPRMMPISAYLLKCNKHCLQLLSLLLWNCDTRQTITLGGFTSLPVLCMQRDHTNFLYCTVAKSYKMHTQHSPTSH